MLLGEVTSLDIERLESRLLREGGRDGKGLSRRTVLQLHRILSSAFNYGVRMRLVARNAMDLVEAPKPARFEVETLRWEDVERLLDVVDDERFRGLVTLALQTGLRRSELLGLQWGDIDFDSGALSVRRGWVKVDGVGGVLEPPKSGRQRVVELPGESLEMLGSLKGSVGGEAGGFVFGGKGGVPMDPGWVSRRFKRYAKEAGFLEMRFHDLRHTHASLLLSDGVHLKVVSERLGHSGVGITGDLYSHVLPTVQLEAVERFGASWRSRLSKGCQEMAEW